MPLKVKSFCTSFLLVLISFFAAFAQTSGDVMRERVSKAKAFIAVRNYNAAIYELENIKRETSDPTVNGVINVLLMNSYLEQGDYNRAQEFLKDLSNAKKIALPGGSANYFAVAGQVVKGARNQLERYRALGLSVSDRTLPIEASVDVQKMRETLEVVVDQSKNLGKEKDKSANAMALLDEATNIRSNLAKDDYDANRWKNEAADAREMIANSRSVVINAVNDPAVETTKPDPNPVAANQPTINANLTAGTKIPTETTSFEPVPTSNIEKPSLDSSKNTQSKLPVETAATTETGKIAEVQKPKPEENKKVTPNRERQVEPEKTGKNVNQPTAENSDQNADLPKNTSPMAVGSLIEYATQKANPVYPVTARSMRMTGVVKIELVVDEQGQVAEVQNTSGPTLLRGAATDAVKKWKFKPFVRDGEPVKATGFVSFNFTL